MTLLEVAYSILQFHVLEKLMILSSPDGYVTLKVYHHDRRTRQKIIFSQLNPDQIVMPYFFIFFLHVTPCSLKVDHS